MKIHNGGFPHKKEDLQKSVKSLPLQIYLESSSLTKSERREFSQFLNRFSDLISDTSDLTRGACHQIDTDDPGRII